jgi:hypothetical protein
MVFESSQRKDSHQKHCARFWFYGNEPEAVLAEQAGKASLILPTYSTEAREIEKEGKRCCRCFGKRGDFLGVGNGHG